MWNVTSVRRPDMLKYFPVICVYNLMSNFTTSIMHILICHVNRTRGIMETGIKSSDLYTNYYFIKKSK